MKVYQIHITGRLHPDIGLDGRTSMASRDVFTEPRDDRDMNYIDPATAAARVVELEVHACPECGQSSPHKLDCSVGR